MPKVRLFAIAESDSSTIAKWGYHPASETLVLVWRSSPNTEYHYNPVPTDLLNSVIHDPETSLGSAVNTRIKPVTHCEPFVSVKEAV